MKTTLLTLVLFIMLSLRADAQVFGTNCPTMEQQQAAYNQKIASSITVTNTYSQQLQTYYQQLATYWQQKHKDNQQIAKDAQQKAKDAQQLAKDAQQAATDQALADRLAAMQVPAGEYDEVLSFIEAIFPLLGSCDVELKKELVRIHTNRSGGGDATNPGGGGNLSGFDNPHMVRMSK